MAGDLPAWIKPHLALGIRKHLDALGIEAVKTGVSQYAPMRGLEIMQPVDLAIAGEMAGSLGEGLQTLEEIAQRQLDLGAEGLTVPAQDIGLAIIEPGKPQAFEQTARLRLPGLIWRRILPQRCSPVRCATLENRPGFQRVFLEFELLQSLPQALTARGAFHADG
jgi:hypothetical protein